MKRSPIGRAFVALSLAAALTAALAGQTLAVDPHLHCLTTPSGNEHSIARGVTFHAPHVPAFHSFHGHAHLGGFDSDHPLFPLRPIFFPASAEC
jgi:hypothetical protein